MRDRGDGTPGLRADLLVVEEHGGLPIVAATLLRGVLAYAVGPFATALGNTHVRQTRMPVAL
jgi:hypothetical protein